MSPRRPNSVRSRSALRLLGALALLTATPACTWIHTDRNVLLATEPAGARILVDGDDTGRTTPDRIGLSGGDHVITFRKEGYRDESRDVLHYTRIYTSKWREGSADLVLWTFPLFWTPGDVLTPIGVRRNAVPAEMVVRLYRDDEPLLGEAALEAARASTGGASEVGPASPR